MHCDIEVRDSLQGGGVVLIIRITEDDPDPGGAPSHGLMTCLAQYGVPHDLILMALAKLSTLPTLVLCKPSDYDAWEIREGG
jgi:hypothetical protein